MASNVVNPVAFLRTSRNFPPDLDQLCVEVNKSYVDIANVTNTCTRGIFPTNVAAQTGEKWYVTGNMKQEGFRKVFNFTSADVSAGFINHGINIINVNQFTNCSGNYIDSTYSYGLIYGNYATPIAGQIVFSVSLTQILLVAGAGAPTVTSGRVILEWISQA